MSRVVLPQALSRLTSEIEPTGDDVLPRLALWLADVSAEAALAPLQPLEQPDDPPIEESAP